MKDFGERQGPVKEPRALHRAARGVEQWRRRVRRQDRAPAEHLVEDGAERGALEARGAVREPGRAPQIGRSLPPRERRSVL
jgi:hypothetical protein